MSTNSLTTLANSPWFRRGITALGALLIVGAMAIGLKLQVRPRLVQPPTAGASIPRPVAHDLITSCKACRDDAVAAAPQRQVSRALAGPSYRTLMSGCGPCREEALVADQLNQASIALPIGASVFETPADLHELGPRRLSIRGTNSAYDGSAYGSAHLRVQTAFNQPMESTWSAYDGGAYSMTRRALSSYSVPVRGMGSAYDGAVYNTVQSTPHRAPTLPVQGTGSAYDGR